MEKSGADVPDHTHGWILARAHAVCPDIVGPLKTVGPLPPLTRRHASVADALYVEIVNQQLSIAAADTIWLRIEEAARRLGVQTKEVFARNQDDLLRACGVSRFKTKALIGLRQAELEGRLDEDSLENMPHEDRSAALTALWGVGQWTADMIGIFHFLDDDIWPDGDVAAVGALRRLARVSSTIELAIHFAPYRSHLARYMWRLRDTK